MATAPETSPEPTSDDRRNTLALLMMATAATCFLGWLFKGHCALDGDWGNLEMYVTGCYSDAYPFWRARGLADGAIPYFQAPMEYPVLAGLLIWFDALWTHGLFGRAAGDPAFVFVVSVANTGLALVVTRLLWGMEIATSRIWAWALAPPLVLYVGHNWDMLAVVLAVAALAAAQQGKLVRACAIAGLGTAAKLFPVLLLPLFALRKVLQVRVTEVALMAAAAIAAWLLVNLPVALAAFDNWWEFYQFSSERSGTRASLWELAGYYGWLATDIPTRNLLSLLVFVAGAAVIVEQGWKRHAERLWLLFTPVLLWFMLSNKVYSPQFDLWAWPFILMTARRWQPIALFAAADIAAYFAEFWSFANEIAGWPPSTMAWILVAALVRAGAMMWLIVDAVRSDPPEWLVARNARPVELGAEPAAQP
jgi:uncharacterized membrane protein